MRLLLFNPETEYALASGASFYTPPASVVRLRHEEQLLPVKWADPEDIILVDDKYSLVCGLRIVQWDELESLFKELPELNIEPWGWNHALARRFTDLGVPVEKIPSQKQLDSIRNLAHRRTTIRLNKIWNSLRGNTIKVDIPQELTSERDCLDYVLKNPGCWLKAPWSSSGRGVINTGADMTEELVRQWCHGIIRRQGSVIGETPAEKSADYATEWLIRKGEARYLGLSSFTTSRRGKYKGNFVMPQKILKETFNTLSHMPIDDVVSAQKEILEEVFAAYEGYLGIDMIVECDKGLRPFVEVNVRRTMGMHQIIE